MGRQWTYETAMNHINKVNRGIIPFGLTFCSACDYLKKSIKEMREGMRR